MVAALGVFDLVEGSGTTSTALLLGGALVLVPAALAAWRATSSEDHAQEVFKAVQDILHTPTDEGRRAPRSHQPVKQARIDSAA